MQVGGRHLLHYFTASRHLAKVRGALGRSGCSPSGDHRSGKERLAVMNLALGQCVFRDERKRGHGLPWKHGCEVSKYARSKAHCGEVVLVKTGVARKRDRGKKLLQRLVALTVQHVLLALCLLEAEIVLQSAAHRIVERELEDVTCARLRGHAPEKRIRGRGRIGSLRLRRHRKPRRSEYDDKSTPGSTPEPQLSKRVHHHLFSQMIVQPLRMQLTCTVFRAISPDESRWRFPHLKPSEPSVPWSGQPAVC